MERNEMIDYFVALVEASTNSEQITIQKTSIQPSVQVGKIEFDGGGFSASIIFRRYGYDIVCDDFSCNLNPYESDRLFALAKKKREELIMKEEDEKISKIRNFVNMKKTNKNTFSFSKETSDILEGEYKKFVAIRDKELQRQYEAGEPLDTKTPYNYDEFVTALRNDEKFQKEQNAKIEEVLFPDGNVEVAFYFNGEKITEIISGC